MEAIEEKNKWITLYPIYFDKDRTLDNGRRVSKVKGISKPLINDLIEAATQLEYQFEIQLTKRHPKEPFVYGRIKINPFLRNSIKQSKQQIIGNICTILSVASAEVKKKGIIDKATAAIYNANPTVKKTPTTVVPPSNEGPSTSATSSSAGPQLVIKKKDKKKK